MMVSKILVVEDEADIRDLIHFNLFKEKFDVDVCEDGYGALEAFHRFNPDLVLLDLMLPGKSGLDICREIKEINKNCLVIMVTARGEEEDIIKGFEMGADDYISKPFSPKVLIARVKAVLKRSTNSAIEKSNDMDVVYGTFSIDLGRRKFSLENNEIELTYSEFQIMELFLKKPGQVFTRSKIVDLIRGENHAISDRSVDVQIVGLRKKLGSFGQEIETVRGVGYRMKDN